MVESENDLGENIAPILSDSAGPQPISVLLIADVFENFGDSESCRHLCSPVDATYFRF